MIPLAVILAALWLLWTALSFVVVVLLLVAVACLSFGLDQLSDAVRQRAEAFLRRHAKGQTMTKLRLTDMNLLAGQTEEISMTELRQRPGDVIDQVQMGKTFKITKAGEIVAVLVKPEPDALELASEVRRLGLQGA